jgi:hypothetical protein
MEAVPNEARRSVGSAAAGVASKRSSREVPTAKVIGEVRRPPGALVALGVLGDSLAYVSLAHGNVQDLFLRALSYLMRSSGLTRPGERFIRAFILWHTRYLTSGKNIIHPARGGGACLIIVILHYAPPSHNREWGRHSHAPSHAVSGPLGLIAILAPVPVPCNVSRGAFGAGNPYLFQRR